MRRWRRVRCAVCGRKTKVLRSNRAVWRLGTAHEKCLLSPVGVEYMTRTQRIVTDLGGNVVVHEKWTAPPMSQAYLDLNESLGAFDDEEDKS